jgi:hypothetical protein
MRPRCVPDPCPTLPLHNDSLAKRSTRERTEGSNPFPSAKTTCTNPLSVGGWVG